MAQTINVNTTPGQFMPTLYYSQGDIGREFEIVLASSDGWSIPAGATVTMVATKPSGFGFSVAGTLTDNVASFTTTETMTNEHGRYPAEIRITSGTDVIGTANFYLSGEKDPHPAETIDGDASEIIPELTLLVERVETAASSVLDMTVNASTLSAGSQATYSYDEETNTATFGIPQGEAGAGAAGVTASAYSSSRTYAVGDYVIHNSNLYRCTTAITTTEAFTAAHWTQVVLADDVSDVKSELNPMAEADSLLNPLNHIINSAINFSNKYVVASNNGGIYIPIKPNDHIVMEKGSLTGYYGLLKNITGYLTNGADVNLCDSFTTIKSIATNGVNIIAPADANYLWVYAFLNGTDYLPSKIIINDYDATIGLARSIMETISVANDAERTATSNDYLLDNVFVDVLRNGVDISDITDNGYWSRDNGTSFLPNNSYSAANPYIKIKGGKTYYGFYDGNSYSYWSVTWYDANKNFISGAIGGSSYIAPNNAEYVRLSWSKVDIDTSKLAFSEYTQAQVSVYVDDLYEFGYDYLLTDYVKNSSREPSVEHSRLFEKKLCVIGDSICYGVGYLGGYAGIIAAENSMEIQNLGISGATLCTGVTGHQSIYSTIASLDNDGDYYIFEGGFNDYNQHVPLFAEGGSFVENIPLTPNGITTNIYDCMENLCYHLNVTFKGKKVGFVFPHKISYTDWEKNNLNLAYKDYKDLQKKVLSKYAIPYIDLSEVSGMNTRYADVANAYTHNGDYVHPNQLGYETYYSPKISSWMNMM